jgi:hypothetical protein
MDIVPGLLLCVLPAAVYFLPTIIAGTRWHVSDGAIFALNLLAGWTALGWLVALVWSLTGNTRENLRYLATGSIPAPPGRGAFVDSAPPTSAAGNRGDPRLSHWIPAAVMGAVALIWLIGWLVIQAEKAREERAAASTVPIAAQRVAAESGELKRMQALAELKSRNPGPDYQFGAQSVAVAVPSQGDDRAGAQRVGDAKHNIKKGGPKAAFAGLIDDLFSALALRSRLRS